MPRGPRKPKLIAPPEETFVEKPPRDQDEDDGDLLENPQSNKKARLEAIDGMLDEWVELQDKEDALIEKFILPVREKKAAVKARAKADYDIPTQAFNARATLRRIELMSDADEVVLALNEMFEATPVGQSVDMEAVLNRVTAKKAEEAKAAEVKKTKVTQPTEKAL